MNKIYDFIRFRLAGYRVLIIAVCFSLCWHVFWLSAIKVVAAPLKQSQTSFSRVSFLGPILSRVDMKVNPNSRERSFLEKRYLAVFAKEEKPSGTGHAALAPHEEDTIYEAGTGFKMTDLISQAVNDPKAEPDISS